MSSAIRQTVWQRTLDADRDWRAFRWTLGAVTSARTVLRIAQAFLSGGTIVVILSEQARSLQIGGAIATAAISALLEYAVTGEYAARLLEAMNFEATAYREWFTLWRRVDDLQLDDVERLERQQEDSAKAFRDLAPPIVVWLAAKRTKDVQTPILQEAAS